MAITYKQFEQNVTDNNKKYKTDSVQNGRITTNNVVKTGLFLGRYLNDKGLPITNRRALNWWNVINGYTTQDCFDLLKAKWEIYFTQAFQPCVDRQIINNNLEEIKSLMLAITAYLSFNRNTLDEYGRIAQDAYNLIYIPGSAHTPQAPHDKYYFTTLSVGIHYIMAVIQAMIIGRINNTNNVVNTNNTVQNVKTPIKLISNFKNNFSNLNAAKEQIRCLKNEAINSKFFTDEQFNNFRSKCYVEADKNNLKRFSESRKWYVAEQTYNFIKNKGKYKLSSVKSLNF